MRELPITEAAGRRGGAGRDLLLAAALGLIFSVFWAIGDWDRLGRLVLPDTDDMMRLAQIRDWLAGQAFDDWSQRRAGPPEGASMHWSRLNDLAPAAIIAALTPLAGRHAAEVAAVLAWPALLFTLNLFLLARIARRLWSAEAAPIASVLGALAYPGITAFLPGRIDHHALQTVMVELTLLALTRPAGVRGGLAAGACAAASLVIGLETAPQLAALLLVPFALWIVRGAAERERLLGIGVGLCGATGLAVLWLRPRLWSRDLCDAFTPASSTAALLGGAALIGLALATPKLRDSRVRLLAGGTAGAVVLAVVLGGFPACLAGPYGAVHPFLLAEYMPHITETIGLLAQPDLASAIGMGGLTLTGVVGAVWMVARRPARWPVTAPAAAVVLASAAVALYQLRGVYLGSPLAAPVLAGLVLAARRRLSHRALALAGAWLLSSGVAHASAAVLANRLVVGPRAPEGTATGSCEAGRTGAALDRFAPGVVMTGVNHAAYLIAATRHSSVGASYHRNDRGNVAMYRFFLSPPARAAAIARRWRVDYAAFCPGDFGEIDVTRRYPGSVAALLAAGRTPPGWRRLPLRDTPMRFYRVEH